VSALPLLDRQAFPPGCEDSRRPDFFIVGAPKCGTTALAHYLGENPRIFVSNPKEPNYFARHLTLGPLRTKADSPHNSFERYLELFAGANRDHVAVGEASTRYLRSRRALLELRRFAPQARIIVQLRNPIELVRSWHSQKLLEGQEVELDLRKAWSLQAEREEGRGLPPGLVAADALFYGHVASLGTQLETLLKIFPREQVQVLFHEDMLSDPRTFYEQTLRFLRVPSDGRTEFPVVNAGRRHRWPRVAALLRRRPPQLEWLIRTLRLRQLGLGRVVQSHSTRADVRGPLAPEFRLELIDYFAPEVEKLAQLTGRDLRHWLKD
jgi:Sulfotransferase domain